MSDKREDRRRLKEAKALFHVAPSRAEVLELFRPIDLGLRSLAFSFAELVKLLEAKGVLTGEELQAQIKAAIEKEKEKAKEEPCPSPGTTAATEKK